jgi:hypothetical protein
MVGGTPRIPANLCETENNVRQLAAHLTEREPRHQRGVQSGFGSDIAEYGRIGTQKKITRCQHKQHSRKIKCDADAASGPHGSGKKSESQKNQAHGPDTSSLIHGYRAEWVVLFLRRYI